MLGNIFQWILKMLSRKKHSGGQDTSLESSPSQPNLSDSESLLNEGTGMKKEKNLPQGHLSKHFTLREATHSATAASIGIDNSPDNKSLEAIKDTAMRMEAVRELLGHPIVVSSWYRNPRVNRAVGGSSTSDHMSGRSVDFRCDGFGSPLSICKVIASSDIEFDQLIYETNSRGSQWVHIGFGERMRGQILTKKPNSGYLNGLIP